jgi:hypothetical protein
MALYLTESDVRQVLTLQDALSAVEDAHRWHATGEAIDTPRARSRTPTSALHMLHGAVLPLGVIGYKSYTTSREAARFWVHLFDAVTGRALAVLEADYLGMMRTGATGGLAAPAAVESGVESRRCLRCRLAGAKPDRCAVRSARRGRNPGVRPASATSWTPSAANSRCGLTARFVRPPMPRRW